MLTDLTALEQRVVEAARLGTWAEGAGRLSVEELAFTEEQSLWVRAELIRELLLDRHQELDPHGVRIREVRVVGQLDLDQVTTTISLHLHGCGVSERITCRDARLRELNLTGSTLAGLCADGLRVNGSLLLRNAVVCDNGEGASVRLGGAHIGGSVEFDGAEVVNDSGPGLKADGMRVDGGLFLRDAIVRGSGEGGAVRLVGAHIGGSVEFDRAEVANDSGPGLHAGDLHVGGNLLLRDATVVGNHGSGAVRLAGAHIGGSVEFDEAEVVNDSGPGLHADSLRVDRDLLLRDAAIRSSSKDGAVHLPSAYIGGQLSLKLVQVGNTIGPLVTLTDAQVAKTLVVPDSVLCSRSGVEVGRRPCDAGGQQVSVQRLEFARLQGMSWRHWLHLLVHHTSDYAPQPFQQLAAVERAAGHDANAREILITQQNELLRRTPEALGGWWGQRRHRLWGWLGRYGYRAQRLVTALVVILALAGSTAYLAGQIPTRPGHHAAERVRPATAPPDAGGAECSTVELVGLGLDRGLPVGATGLRTRCDLDTGTKRGQAFTVLLWLLQAALWALATLTVAAYTGMIRKPT